MGRAPPLAREVQRPSHKAFVCQKLKSLHIDLAIASSKILTPSSDNCQLSTAHSPAIHGLLILPPCQAGVAAWFAEKML
jgi:hypothetical protein